MEVEGPCGGCDQARECCSHVRLSFTPDKVRQIPPDFLSNPRVRVVYQDPMGDLEVEVDGVCPEFDGTCSAHEAGWRSADCERWPRDNDGELTARENCPRWGQFPPDPVNQIVFDVKAGEVVVR